MPVFKRTPPRQGAISIGRRIFRFKTHGSRRHYSIHEHLVCNRSRFFKDRVQKDRKPIEGECSICHEDLDPKQDDVTFCRGTCGQNFHEDCIEEWTQTHTICPMCRRNWQQASGEPDTLDEVLDPDGVQLYLDWLYIDRLQLPEQVRRDAEEYTMFMYKAWAASDAVQDAEFRHAIIAEILSSRPVQYTTDVMHYIFVEQSSPTMKAFVIDLMRATDKPDKPGNFIASIPNYPIELTQALFGALLKSYGEPLSIPDLVKRHTSDNYGFTAVPRGMPPGLRRQIAAGNRA